MGDGQDALSDAVAAAKADVLQRCGSPTSNATWFDGQPLGKGSLFVITSMFDGIASLARLPADDASSSINLYRSIERLTGNHARESPAFRDLGRHLGVSIDTGGGEFSPPILVAEAAPD